VGNTGGSSGVGSENKVANDGVGPLRRRTTPWLKKKRTGVEKHKDRVLALHPGGQGRNLRAGRRNRMKGSRGKNNRGRESKNGGYPIDKYLTEYGRWPHEKPFVKRGHSKPEIKGWNGV